MIKASAGDISVPKKLVILPVLSRTTYRDHFVSVCPVVTLFFVVTPLSELLQAT